MLDPTIAIDEDPADILEYLTGELPVIHTAMFSPPPTHSPEYSPLEQDALSVWDVLDQLSAAALHFERLEDALALADPAAPLPGLDGDVAFWLVEALNLLVGDYAELAAELAQFAEFVHAVLAREHADADAAPPPVRALPRASFDEREMRDVLESARNIPDGEVAQALAALEAAVPFPDKECRPPRERPPSLRLSTSDVVLLQAQQQPRSRLQSVGAPGRFAGNDASIATSPSASSLQPGRPQDEVLKKHRAYVIYGDVSAVAVCSVVPSFTLAAAFSCLGQLVDQERRRRRRFGAPVWEATNGQ